MSGKIDRKLPNTKLCLSLFTIYGNILNQNSFKISRLSYFYK